MKLYDISESDIARAIDAPDVAEKEHAKIVAVKKFGGRFHGFPLKVVYEKETNKELFVITVYPLKKKLWGQP